MRRWTRTCLTTAAMAVLILTSASALQSQLLVDLFHYDVPRYFTGTGQATWVGSASMLTVNYTDTLHVSLDSSGTSVIVQRVLVNDDDKVVVSYGRGVVTPEPGDTSFTVSWIEKKYAEATGRMAWDGTQWVTSFDGEWKQWFINIREIDDKAFEAAVARRVGAFPAVELMDVTYHRLR